VGGGGGSGGMRDKKARNETEKWEQERVGSRFFVGGDSVIFFISNIFSVGFLSLYHNSISDAAISSKSFDIKHVI